jgi:hypothetical protein
MGKVEMVEDRNEMVSWGDEKEEKSFYAAGVADEPVY